MSWAAPHAAQSGLTQSADALPPAPELLDALTDHLTDRVLARLEHPITQVDVACIKSSYVCRGTPAPQRLHEGEGQIPLVGANALLLGRKRLRRCRSIIVRAACGSVTPTEGVSATSVIRP